MSFDLTVQFSELPPSLGSRWIEAFATEGFELEHHPGFDPANHPGGFLPFRVFRAPEELVGMKLPGEGVSGFEVDFEPGEAQFRSAMGRTTTEFALMCVGAASLAQLSGGIYGDPQSGLELRGDEAMTTAKNEIKAYLKSAEARDFAHHDFPGWEALTGG